MDPDDFGFPSCPRVPLQSCITYKDVVDSKEFKFAVDGENVFGSDDDDEEDDSQTKGNCQRPYRLYEDPEYQLQEEDEDPYRLENSLPNFDELEQQMETIDPNGFVKKLVIKEGNSIPVLADSKVFIHYAAFSEKCPAVPYDGTRIYGRSAPLGVLLGGNEIVVGLRIGLQSMHIGEISKFLVYPKLAYGALGCPPRIPPGAKMVYVVEMLRFIPVEKLADVMYKNATERAELPFNDILQAAISCKEKGNAYYEQGEYVNAMKTYSRGIDMLENYPTANVENNRTRDKELPELYCNKAQCHLKMESPARACVACKLGLRTTDRLTKPKLLFRFAKAKYMLKAFDQALNISQEVITLFKETGALEEKHTELLKKIKESIEVDKQREKFLCQKMFGFSVQPKANPEKKVTIDKQ